MEQYSDNIADFYAFVGSWLPKTLHFQPYVCGCAWSYIRSLWAQCLRELH